VTILEMIRDPRLFRLERTLRKGKLITEGRWGPSGLEGQEWEWVAEYALGWRVARGRTEWFYAETLEELAGKVP